MKRVFVNTFLSAVKGSRKTCCLSFSQLRFLHCQKFKNTLTQKNSTAECLLEQQFQQRRFLHCEGGYRIYNSVKIKSFSPITSIYNERIKSSFEARTIHTSTCKLFDLVKDSVEMDSENVHAGSLYKSQTFSLDQLDNQAQSPSQNDSSSDPKSLSLPDRSLSEMSRTVYNLAPYVKESVTLQKMVKIGVNLSKVEKVKGMSSMLLMSDFDTDILPYLQHLAKVGVAPDKLGYIITRNPLLLTEYIERLEQRVGYLLSKNFKLKEIAYMYEKAPVIVLMDPIKLDTKLTFLQKNFSLTDRQVKKVVLFWPDILPLRHQFITEATHDLKELCGFEDKELKLMALKNIEVFSRDGKDLIKVFDYVHNTMGISHSLMVHWPGVLNTKFYRIKDRHRFLLNIGRAQYDPCLENYVSLEVMCDCNDVEFCQKVAKTSLTYYQSFLKTL